MTDAFGDVPSEIKTLRQVVATLTAERDAALAELRTVEPTTCGTNAFRLPTRMGCGQPIGLETHIFRCTDCRTVFHRDCLKKHCTDDLAAATALLRETQAVLAVAMLSPYGFDGRFAAVDLRDKIAAYLAGFSEGETP